MNSEKQLSSGVRPSKIQDDQSGNGSRIPVLSLCARLRYHTLVFFQTRQLCKATVSRMMNKPG